MDEGMIVLDGDPREILNSEQARLIGVGIPKATRLYQLLQRDGIDFGNCVPLSSEELATSLRKALQTDD
jgi:hypothetical protein